MPVPPDPRDLYHLEEHLFQTVSPRFAQQGYLDAFDFFCIVIWKSNRSKSIVARGMQRGGLSLEDAAVALTSRIYRAGTDRERFDIATANDGFGLPMASAVLSVCYPERFTVYDYRVCDSLRDFHNLSHRRGDGLWTGYERFCAAVRGAAPPGLPLRDCDRWLWGASFRESLTADIVVGFRGV